ncbi:DNA-binding protein [Tsukamurella sp. PLM1]|nr:DNA-binding protein [Tsukamurella sp. PLM1]
MTVSSIPFVSDDLLPEGTDTYNTSTVAKGLGVSQSKVLQLLRDHQLIAVKRGGDVHIPRLFFGEVDGRFAIAKHFTGLLSVLRDGGFRDDEIMRWLFEQQEDLGDCPAELLHTDSAREVIRRAQSMAF